MDEVGDSDQPRKRVKLSGVDDGIASELTLPSNSGSAVSDDTIREQLEKETRAGIRAYVNPQTPGFSGILKQRYTDFCVYEVLPSGRVLHLDSLEVPQTQEDTQTNGKPSNSAESQSNGQVNVEANEPTPVEPQDVNGSKNEAQFEISSEDKDLLITIFGEETATRSIALSKAMLNKPDRKPREFTPVFSLPITDKVSRTTAHQAVRRIFAGRLETSTEPDNTFKISPAPQVNKNNRAARNNIKGLPKGKLGWDQLGGQYLHFSLLKENRDTMEVVGFLASQLKVKPKEFGFAGTKDRRGVTVQRVSVFRVHAQRMAQLAKGLRGSLIGGYDYHPTCLQLGDLSGNEFEIALRDCQFPNSDGLSQTDLVEHAKTVVGEAVQNLTENGFINYFGLQRFGSFSSSTDKVGMKLLQENLQDAVDYILEFSPAALHAAHNPGSDTSMISSDDKARAEALHIWKTTQNAHNALEKLPRKFTAEKEIIRHLGWTDRRTGERIRPNDYQGALQNIPRNLRLMYVHAYQSFIWNVVAGKRWETYGGKVVEGDLVIIGEDDNSTTAAAEEEFDEHGEPIIRPTAADSAAVSTFVRARPLSSSEAASGKYTIFDVVLPLPGWDVVYPPNEIGKFYTDFMGSDEGGHLNPHDMKRKWKDISLSGGYRKLISKPAERMSFEVREYVGEEAQLIETDADRLGAGALQRPTGEMSEQQDGEGEKKRIAVILKLQLGSSQYATMALRELMKAGGVRTFKAEYTAR